MLIKMFPAKKGDCFLISFKNGKNIIVDMGYGETYRKYLRPQMKILKEKGQCIDLLVITHTDSDHIGGAVAFFKENKEASKPQVIPVKEIWYNSYCHVPQKLLPADQFAPVISSDQQDCMKRSEFAYLAESELQEGTSGISYSQGDTLAGLLYRYGYQNLWNTSFQGKAVCRDKQNIVCKDGIEIRILSPDAKSLEKLAKAWMTDLRKRFPRFQWNGDALFDDDYEAFAKHYAADESVTSPISSKRKTFQDYLELPSIMEEPLQDTSKTNGASVAMAISYGGKRGLFLGDAHEAVFTEGLEDLNQYNFDVVKVAHHGSARNNIHWMERISASRFLFSTNGAEEGCPSLQVIAKILLKSEKRKQLYFNYVLDDLKAMIDREDFKRTYSYDVRWDAKEIEV